MQNIFLEPCNRGKYIKKTGDVEIYQCLGHLFSPSFHYGLVPSIARDPGTLLAFAQHCEAFDYDKILKSQSATKIRSNLLSWCCKKTYQKFMNQDITRELCSNCHQDQESKKYQKMKLNKNKNLKKYVCLGHVDGDHLEPTFHGDPSRNFAFYVVGNSVQVANPLAFEYRFFPNCDKFKVGESNKGYQEYFCLGHSQTFHGDPLRSHYFYMYPPNLIPPNLGLWDFIGEPRNICSNFKEIDKKKRIYQCLGHSQEGDIGLATYHGDPQNDYRYRLIPETMQNKQSIYDFRTNPCKNSQEIQNNDKQDPCQYFQCQGHLKQKQQ
eukprot:403341674